MVYEFMFTPNKLT